MQNILTKLSSFLNPTTIKNSNNDSSWPDIRQPGTVVKEIFNRKYYSVPGPLRIHAEGDIEFVSDKHIMLNSGQTPEERLGYLHSVWFNTERDQYGRPIQSVAPGKHTKWLPYGKRYRTQLLSNKLRNRSVTSGGCGGCGGHH